MGKTHDFEIEGIRFELSHLSVDDACAGLEVLAKIMGPALEQLGAATDDGTRRCFARSRRCARCRARQPTGLSWAARAWSH
jgi:hypothetical protein